MNRRGYTIIVEGRLPESYADWFDGFSITPSDKTTALVGHSVDQSALFGALNTIRDLGLRLRSVQPICDTKHQHGGTQ